MSGQSLSLRGPFRPNDAFSRSYQSSDESESGSPGAGGPSSPRFQRDFGAQFRPTRHDTSTFSLYDEDPPYIPPGGPFASGIGYPGQRHTELYHDPAGFDLRHGLSQYQQDPHRIDFEHAQYRPSSLVDRVHPFLSSSTYQGDEGMPTTLAPQDLHRFGPGHYSQFGFEEAPTALHPSAFENRIPDAGDYLRQQLDIPIDKSVNLWALPDPPGGEKPSIPYPVLIKLALYGSDRKRLTLQEIYSAIQERFEWYRKHSQDNAWKNSIRHNLSLNKVFRAVARPVTEPGKGKYWELDVSEGEGYKRERKRNKGKRSALSDIDALGETDDEERSSSENDEYIDPMLQAGHSVHGERGNVPSRRRHSPLYTQPSSSHPRPRMTDSGSSTSGSSRSSSTPVIDPPPSQSRLGYPSTGPSSFRQPAFGQPAFGEPAFGQPAYGQPAVLAGSSHPNYRRRGTSDENPSSSAAFMSQTGHYAALDSSSSYELPLHYVDPLMRDLGGHHLAHPRPSSPLAHPVDADEGMARRLRSRSSASIRPSSSTTTEATRRHTDPKGKRRS